jgi:hypothetical protein
MQRYKYINMIQVKKKQRYNELKYRGKNSLIMLNKDTEIFDTKNINLYFSLLGVFFVQGLLKKNEKKQARSFNFTFAIWCPFTK